MSVSPARTPDQIILNTISSIGRFEPKPFVPHGEKKIVAKTQEIDVGSNFDCLRTLQAKNEKLTKSVSNLEQNIGFLEGTIQRHQKYMIQTDEDHQKQVSLLKQQIENRKQQLSNIDTSQEPPTIEQLKKINLQIQVEGMAAKRHAKDCIPDQDINIALSGERLKKFHDVLVPKVTDQIMQENPKLRKCIERLENSVYKSAEMQTQLRSIKIFSTSLERRLNQMKVKQESLQNDKSDIQDGIANKKNEYNSELTNKCEELGKLRWKIEYMRALKKKMSEPHFDVRKLDA